MIYGPDDFQESDITGPVNAAWPHDADRDGKFFGQFQGTEFAFDLGILIVISGRER